MTEAQYKREGYDLIDFHYITGFAEFEGGYQLRIGGRDISFGDTPKDALVALLAQIDKLEAFKASVESLVKGPYVPWAGRTGDYE